MKNNTPLEELTKKAKEIKFNMGTDLLAGELIQTLISSKVNGDFLELGTGMGISTTWMLNGMDEESKLTSIDNNPELIEIVSNVLGNDSRLELITENGSVWIKEYDGAQFDLIFADAWPGKYSDLEKTLELVKPGGFYIIDDMLPQPNWPIGHELKAEALLDELKGQANFRMNFMNWSTGIVILTRTS
tara:strand:+ start:167 stop:730 length:564 start_codon:yes stop_codon:yes gene_type:complete